LFIVVGASLLDIAPEVARIEVAVVVALVGNRVVHQVLARVAGILARMVDKVAVVAADNMAVVQLVAGMAGMAADTLEVVVAGSTMKVQRTLHAASACPGLLKLELLPV
jgi:ACT domain-containing protein